MLAAPHQMMKYWCAQTAESRGWAASASLCGDVVVCTESLMPSLHMASTLAGSSLKRRLITVWVLFLSVRLCNEEVAV